VSGVNPATGIVSPDVAVARAQAAGLVNKAYVGAPTPVSIAAGDVEVIGGDKVKVTTRREGDESIITYFAQVLGITGLQMKADATAKVEPASGVLCGLVPLAVVPAPGEEFHTGCGTGYILKQGGGAGSNGNYGAVDYPSCATSTGCSGPTTGAKTYECLLENGYCCNVTIGQSLTTEPGNMSGPTQKGIEARFANDTDKRTGICYSQYTGNGQRVVFIPVITDPGNGRSPVTVLRFGAFFIKNIPGNGNNSVVEGEFVYYVVPGLGGGDPTGAVAYAIRLIE